MAKKQLLRRTELAKKLEVSVRTIDYWVAEGKLPMIEHPLGRGPGRVLLFDWQKVCKALKIQG